MADEANMANCVLTHRVDAAAAHLCPVRSGHRTVRRMVRSSHVRCCAELI
jgi:hypothetical protein